MKFHEFIKIKRKQNKVQVDDICKALDISKTTFHRLEEGGILEPVPSMLRKLAEILRADYYYLMDLCGYIDGKTSTKWITKQNHAIHVIPWAILHSLKTITNEAMFHLSKEHISTDLEMEGLFALKILDTRWVPYCLLGDILFVQRGSSFEAGDILLILIDQTKQKLDRSLPPATLIGVSKIGDQFHISRIGMADNGIDEPLTKGIEDAILGRVVRIERRLRG